MRVLIIGAGVLGSNLAHCLKKKHDVTLFVRETSYSQYEQEGIVIKQKFKKKKLIDRYSMITKLEPDDLYDVILVPIRFSQLGPVHTLIDKNKSKTVIFIGNNLEADKVMMEGKNVLFGFFHAAGYRHDGYIDSVCMKKITIGECQGNGGHDAFLRKLLEKTGVKLILENNMDAWLKAHGVSILPLVFACYTVDGDLRKLSKNKEYSYKVVQAIKEGYDVLRTLGYEIVPQGEYETVANRQGYCAWLYRFLFSNWIGQMCISNHAMHAKDEMEQMLVVFETLKNKSKIQTPVFDELRSLSNLNS